LVHEGPPAFLPHPGKSRRSGEREISAGAGHGVLHSSVATDRARACSRPGSRRAAEGGMAALNEWRHHVAQTVEALADGQPLLRPEVDPLEYRGDLEEGEADVPGQRGKVQ